MIPYKLIGYGLAAIAVAFLTWKVIGWRNDSLAYKVMKPAYEEMVESQRKANAAVEAQAPLDEAERIKLAEEKKGIEEEKAKIGRAWERVKAVKETHDETGNVVVRLSDGWGVCFSAAAAADAADVAACQATGGNGAIEGSPGS